jgi:hypothetical protein
VRKQYILWHCRDIIINASSNPLQRNQEWVPPKIQMLQFSRTRNNLWWVGSREATMRIRCHYYRPRNSRWRGMPNI